MMYTYPIGAGLPYSPLLLCYEAVHYHGHLLDDSTRNHCERAVVGSRQSHDEESADVQPPSMVNNVNYSASGALQALGEMFDRRTSEGGPIVGLEEGLTANDSYTAKDLKYGHLPRRAASQVDLGYNVDLPNLAYYAW